MEPHKQLVVHRALLQTGQPSSLYSRGGEPPGHIRTARPFGTALEVIYKQELKKSRPQNNETSECLFFLAKVRVLEHNTSLTCHHVVYVPSGDFTNCSSLPIRSRTHAAVFACRCLAICSSVILIIQSITLLLLASG